MHRVAKYAVTAVIGTVILIGLILILNLYMSHDNNDNSVAQPLQAYDADGSSTPKGLAIPISPNVEPYDVNVILYFMNEDGDRLVPEMRVIKKGPENIELLIMNELLKGPMQKGHLAILPPEVKLLSVTSRDGIAFVDLSKEFMSAYESDPAKRTLMVYSIVDTLTELKGINKVQFLIEGQKAFVLAKTTESLDNMQNDAGDTDKSEPLTRNNKLIQNPIDAVNAFLKSISANDIEKAYIYMSDESVNNNRMSQQQFKDYINSLNFSITKFTVYDYSLEPDGNRALVTVDFEIKLSNGDVIKKDKVLIRSVRLNGIWKVDWELPFDDADLKAANIKR